MPHLALDTQSSSKKLHCTTTTTSKSEILGSKMITDHMNASSHALPLGLSAQRQKSNPRLKAHKSENYSHSQSTLAKHQRACTRLSSQLNDAPSAEDKDDQGACPRLKTTCEAPQRSSKLADMAKHLLLIFGNKLKVRRS